MYPDAEKDWDIYIPMDVMAHNFSSVIILIAILISMLKTKYRIGDLFIAFTFNLSIIDVLTKGLSYLDVLPGGGGFYEFNWKWYSATIIISALIAILAHYKIQKSNAN